jgi:murein L,D-transpeptidase YcbB/YkuD
MSASAADAVQTALRNRARGAVGRFYAARAYRPIWAANGRIGPAADTLIGYLASADLDGLKPSSYGADKLRRFVAQSRTGDAAAIAAAEVALSEAFANYVRDQRRPGGERMTFADPTLKPKRLRAEQVLRAAAFPKSFETYVADMGWMSEHYVRLRRVSGRGELHQGDARATARLARNLDRARLLPSPQARHIVVDASSGQLWFYEAGRQVGTMRVVVGARETQTPMLAGKLQWAILNPYWNVPTYLARNSIAPKVLAGRSLAAQRLELLSDWSTSAQKLPASAVDWQAVASGGQEVRLRELPGAGNSMGRVKFLFPNDEGIYLHDTPDRDLLRRADRHLSNGCIRLENAALLGRWLLGRPITAAGRAPEQAVPLPVQVPVYLTYLTADARTRDLIFREDVYDRD